jgi:hypothetical protein
MNLSFVNAGAIALRLRDQDHQSSYGGNDRLTLLQIKRGSKEIYAWVFLLISFVTAMCFGFKLKLSIPFLIVTLAFMGYMSTLP